MPVHLPMQVEPVPVDGGLLVEPVGEVRGEHGARFDDEGRIEPDPLASLGAVDQHLRLPARR
jgi:hypothetical protein